MDRAARARLALAITALWLLLTAWLVQGEYQVLHGGAVSKQILEERVWITIAILAGLGLLGILVGMFSRRQKAEN
jgi:hypothetical protein